MPTHILRTARLFILTSATIALCNGCAGIGSVQPWEKGNLAKAPMTFEGDSLEQKFDQHTYGSKENASGGYGVGGGGCGCN